MRSGKFKLKLAPITAGLLTGAMIIAGAIAPGSSSTASARGAHTSRVAATVQKPVAPPVPAAVTGETATHLPDGRWLLVGGIRDGAVSNEISVVANSEAPGGRPFTTTLEFPRSGHTATVLPNGTVLIFGGRDPEGELVPTAELIDPIAGTVTPASTGNLTLRAFHSATLLTDGRVLIAGGSGGDGSALDSAEIWDPVSGLVSSPLNSLGAGRYGQKATLLANGEVILEGGQGDSSQSVPRAELYDPATNSFQMPSVGLPLRAPTAAAPAIAGSLPEADAVGVSVDGALTIRFEQPVQIDKLNASTITLVGPGGAVGGKVVGAEGGMLAFFTPTIELSPGTIYTLFLSGVTNVSDSTLPFTSIRFTTQRLENKNSQTSSAAGSGSADGTAASARHPKAPSSQTAGTSKAGAAAVPLKSQTAAAQKPEESDDDPEDWTPSEKNRHGQWHVLGSANDPKLTLATFTKHTASAGQTAVSGRVLRYNGKPLTGAAVSVGGKSTLTDASGSFLLAGLAEGATTLKVDGTAVIVHGRHYTKHFIRVTLGKGITTAINDPIYLPRIDPTTEVAISSPAAHEVVLTHPAIPGLEVHIPKGVVLREYDGKIVTSLSITPIPIDRAPYPTPVPFSVYFTLQPGGAYVEGDAGKSIKVIYPNYLGLAPGVRVNFWNYDPDSGWKVYGQGAVSRDGKQVVPDAGVGFRQNMSFGFGLGPAGNPAADGPPPGGCETGGDPVDCATGLFLHSVTDLSIDDVVPIVVNRTYRQNDNVSRAFGIGTNLSYAMTLYTSSTAAVPPSVDLVLSDGARLHYALQSGTTPDTAVWINTGTPTAFTGSVLTEDAAAHGWKIVLRDQTIMRFAPHSPNGLLSITDRNGNVLTVTNTPAETGGTITQVTSPNGRYIQFTYDNSSRIILATDNIGRTVGYAYDTTGHLKSVTDANGKTESYSYDANGRLQTVTDRRGTAMVTNTYDPTTGRVIQQDLPDGSWHFSYVTDSNNKVQATTVTNPRGFVTQDTFNSAGYLTQQVFAVGQPEQQIFTFQRDSNNNLQTVTDPLNRQTHYTYDSLGQVLSVTRLFNTADAVTDSYTYDPTFHLLLTHTDPLTHTTTLGYDTRGNITSVTDPLQNKSTITIGAQGLPTVIQDPLGHQTQLAYQQADLASTTDALGRVSKQFTDGVGRVQSTTDALGRMRQVTYDPEDRVTRVVDAINGATTLGYDENGNLLTFTDPRGQASHVYTYDARNRAHTYADPSGATQTFTYDSMGNLTTRVDAKNQSTIYTYDGLNRIRTVTYADGSSLTVNWDGGNRPTSFVDSANGTISRIYDGLDRLKEESGPQGTVDYTYDAAGRRATLTVSGQSTPISYGYDNADRLTSIFQGSTIVGIGYDAASRRTGVTLPNGIVVAYGFDNADQLTSINYDKGAVHIGDLAYGYDAGGQRITQSGSLARMLMPSNPAGSLAAWASATYTYNARDQLTATSWGNSTFSYDALGRRTSRNVSGTATNYLYDGQNPVGVNGSLMLEGLGADEYFARVSAGAVTSFLTDALGSTLALTDAGASTTASYSYGAYGNASKTGSDDTPFQYTGRENDGAANLYYYRARYYNPTFAQFNSADPAGLSAGPNAYAYAGGNPISFTDPSGMFISSVDAACIQDPDFCAELLGQIAQNAAAQSGDPCLQEAAAAVSGALKVAGTIGGIIRMAPSWKSKPKYGHTFERHGAGTKNTRNLVGRAATEGKPQGQWTDNQKAADYLDSFKFDGNAWIRIPPGLGQVVKADGSIVPAEWAKVSLSPTGIRSAYPIIF